MEATQTTISAVLSILSGLLPLVCLAGLAGLFRVWNKDQDWRSALGPASLVWGVFVVAGTEFLSCFQAISRNSLLVLWLCLFFTLCALYKRLRIRPSLKNISIPGLVLPIIIIIIGTLVVGIVYPPNNYDSMTYHLPKVEQWLQNGSLAHFATSNSRQTALAPFTELCILQVRALSGGDWLSNSIQWLAFVGAIINVSSLAARLGVNPRGQRLAALFCASIPMAVLQASSTQTDLVEAYWLTCAAELFLGWLTTPRTSLALWFGLAMGLACLSKGTAYPLLLPFVLAYAFMVLRRPRAHLLGALMAALLLVSLNAPHLWRNYKSYGDPLGQNGMPNYSAELSLRGVLAIGFSNLLSNEPPMPDAMRDGLNQLAEKFYKAIGVETTDEHYFWQKISPLTRPKYNLHEDTAQNPIQIIILLISVTCVIFKRKSKLISIYIVIYISAWLVFCSALLWQPWITRLQLPLLVLGSPLIGILIQGNKSLASEYILAAMLTISSIFPLLFNKSRPLVFSARLQTSSVSVWNSNRESLYFINKIKLAPKYIEAVRYIKRQKPIMIGIVSEEDSWEYPLWILLNYNNTNYRPHIEHICLGNSSIPQYIEALFVIDIRKISCLDRDNFVYGDPEVIICK